MRGTFCLDRSLPGWTRPTQRKEGRPLCPVHLSKGASCPDTLTFGEWPSQVDTKFTLAGWMDHTVPRPAPTPTQLMAPGPGPPLS